MDNFCLDEIHDKNIVSSADCSARAGKAALSDLEGLVSFDKTTHQLMCTMQYSERSKEQRFIKEMFEPTTEEEFQKIVNDNLISTTSFTWTLPPPANDGVNLNPAKGYQPDEFLLGNKVIGEQKVFKELDKVSFPTPSIFGHCSDHDYLKFMQNEETESCVLKDVQSITEEACKQVSFNNFGEIELRTGDGSTSIKAKVGEVRKFSVHTFKEVDLSGETQYTEGFMPSKFDAGTNTCDNFVLEMHYKVYFKPATVEEFDAFEHPPNYDCASGAVLDSKSNDFCPNYDLCAKNPDTPTKWNYLHKNNE